MIEDTAYYDYHVAVALHSTNMSGLDLPQALSYVRTCSCHTHLYGSACAPSPLIIVTKLDTNHASMSVRRSASSTGGYICRHTLF